MSFMWAKNHIAKSDKEVDEPIAIFCSDLHLSHKPPICRNETIDEWYEAQERVLCFVNMWSLDYKIPIFCAGDIFHVAKSCPKLELLAIQKISSSYKWQTIAGQHDLPYHNADLINESSYGIIKAIKGGNVLVWDKIKKEVDLLDWEVKPKKTDNDIAVIHRLVWENEPFPDAPKEGNTKAIYKEFKEYNLIVAGDNHQGFISRKDNQVILNCGSMMRRNADQIDYQPKIYLLFKNKDKEYQILPIDIPIKNDKISDNHITDKEERDERIETFVDELKNNIDFDLSFLDNCERYFVKNKVEDNIKKIIIEAIGE